MQIFSQGIPIYIKDENEFTRQKMRAYSMYATLSEQRASVIESIKEWGSVFGDEWFFNSSQKALNVALAFINYAILQKSSINVKLMLP